MLLYACFTSLVTPGLGGDKNFRQWGSRTPGHPSWASRPGVENYHRSLGQGFANGVGMAIAEAHLAKVITDPDLMYRSLYLWHCY
jgi:transketolase